MSDAYEWEAGWGMEDVAIEYEEERQRAIQQYIEDVENKIWIDKSGKRWSIFDMTTNHIENCLKKIQSLKGKWRADYEPIFINELNRRIKQDPTYHPYVVKDETRTIVRTFRTYSDANTFLFSRGNPAKWTIEQRYNID